MKLVIEIDEVRFKDIQRIASVQLENNHFKTAEQIIASGTPLPKGHGRLIDADRLKEHIDKLPALPDGNFAGNHSALKALINMQPSVEPEKCGDCVSRKATLDEFKRIYFDNATVIRCAELVLGKIPSVEPERKPGKWIKAIDPDVNAWTGGHTCSECGRVCVQMSMNYCANCGAKMEVHDGK